jgi:hypothetical protein
VRGSQKGTMGMCGGVLSERERQGVRLGRRVGETDGELVAAAG